MKPTEVIEKAKVIATWMGYEYKDAFQTKSTYLKPRAFAKDKRLTGRDSDERVEEITEHPRGWYAPRNSDAFDYQRNRSEARYRGKTVYDLGFDSDWGKLMEVVSQIEWCVDGKGDPIQTSIDTDYVRIGFAGQTLEEKHERKKILMVFDMVAQWCTAELAKPESMRAKPKPFNMSGVLRSQVVGKVTPVTPPSP